MIMNTKSTKSQLPTYKGKYYSVSLNQSHKFAYFLPQGMTLKSEVRLPVLFLLHGFSGSFRDWAECARLAKHLAGYQIAIIMPDGGNGYYTNGAKGGDRWEDDLIFDLIPRIEATLPVLPKGKNWGVAGLSMGGYGAVKLALKHWETFSVGASFSGSLNVPGRPGSHEVFGDSEIDREMRKKESVFWLAEQALCRFPWERPRLFLDCGKSDPLLEETEMFSNHLNFLGYAHTLRELPGQHTWPYWDRAFRTLLPTLAEALGVERIRPELEELL